MTADENRQIRVELHLHTCGSFDSLVDPERLLRHIKKIGIDRVAITDHNVIENALKLKALAPDRIIVGEEIETTQGELIGYFMTEWVPPDLEPREAIDRLRAQGAVIAVPHPFDSRRKPQWTRAQLLNIVSLVDAVEVFNARCLSMGPNQEAENFAQEHGLLRTVGSDAHSIWEVGRATLDMPSFNDSHEFKVALQSAQPITHRSPAFVLLFSRFAFFSKKVKKYFS